MANFYTRAQKDELVINLLIELDQVRVDCKAACQLYFELGTTLCAQDWHDLQNQLKKLETQLWNLGINTH